MPKRLVDILLIRMDKIGDLVLSLSADEHPALAGQRVHWFITRGLAFITDQSTPKRHATEFGRRFSIFEWMRMIRWLRAHRPQTVVLLHCPWWVAIAVWMAGVPERIGRLSQWHSFFTLNIPIRQKRSKADRHESDFNFDLIEFGFNRLGVRKTFDLNAIKKSFLRLLSPNPFGTIQQRSLKSKGYRVVHPGMAGSALNWPQKFYFELIQKLAQEYPVVITGTKSDESYLTALNELKKNSEVVWLVDQLKPNELLDILSQAKSVIGPSTGVIHLAASLGTPVVGIYSPRTVEHPRRWGPKGLSTAVLLPPVQSAELFDPSVMEQITPEMVFENIHQLETAKPIKKDNAVVV